MQTQDCVTKLSETNEDLKKQVKSLQEDKRNLQAKLQKLEQSSQQERDKHEITVTKMKQSLEKTTDVRKYNSCVYIYMYMSCQG